jgi:hypothetical protein
MIDAYKQSVFAYEDSALATVLVGLQKLAERVGFEPTDDCSSPRFKRGAFGRSTTSPYGAQYTRFIACC